jgi:mRNA interferase RelE/StbE
VKYRLVIRHSAEKELGRLGHEEQRRIAPKLLHLESEPFPAGAIALQGRRGYRIRIGDYRVLYEVDEASKIITITAIGHRRDVYR